MFIAEERAIQIIQELRALLERIGHRDRDLKDQIARAASSAALNTGEGAGRCGKDRCYHYSVASASANSRRRAKPCCAMG